MPSRLERCGARGPVGRRVALAAADRASLPSRARLAAEPARAWRLRRLPAHGQRTTRRRRRRHERRQIGLRIDAPAEQRQVGRLRLGADDAVEIEPWPDARGRPAVPLRVCRARPGQVGQRSPIIVAGPHRQVGRRGLHVGQGELVPAVAAAVRFLESDVGALGALHGSRPGGTPGCRLAGCDRLPRDPEHLLDLGAQAIRVGLRRIQRRDRVEQVQRGEHVARLRTARARGPARSRPRGAPAPAPRPAAAVTGPLAGERWSARMSASSNSTRPAHAASVTATTLVIVTA